VTEPFRTAGRLVCSLPDLDPYPALRRDPVIGPVQGLQEPQPLPDGPPHFFAYLDLVHETTWPMLQGLKASRMNGEIYLRGMNDEVARALKRPGLTVHREFQPFKEIFARASVVLVTCQGNSAQGLPRVLSAIAADRGMAERAVALAYEIKSRGLQQTVDRILNTCFSVLASSTDTNTRVGVAQ
jgi:hypothetical protein